MADSEESKATEAAPEGGGLLAGVKGWIIVVSAVLLEAFFFIIFIRFSHTDGENQDVSQQLPDASVLPFNPMELSYNVPGKLTFIVHAAGITLAVNMAVTLEFDWTEEERRNPKDKNVPSEKVLIEYRKYTDATINRLKDFLNQKMITIDPGTLQSVTGQKNVRDEIKRFLNNELEKFLPKGAPPDMDRRRVTNVLLPEWHIVPEGG